MAIYQDDFSLRHAKGVPGMRCNTEPENVISRTVESAAGIAFGQPAFRGSDDHGCVVGGAFDATGAGSEAAGNVGTGTITDAPEITAGAKQGRYRAVLIATSATAPYLVYDPDGILVGDGVVASANTSIPGITTFTISNAGTMTAGDTFYIDVSFDANAKLLGFVVIDPSVPAIAATPDYVPQNFTASIMNEGMLWNLAGATVADGDDVYWNPATGRFTNTVTHIPMPGVIFDTSGSDGDLVRLAIRKRIQ